MTSPIAPLSALQGPAAAKQAEPIDPKAMQAAKEFEAIFLRTLLSSMEKTTSINGGGKLNTGQSTYGSMAVGALADSVSKSGGIGLADIVAKSLSAHLPHAAADPKPLK